jgi:hypothetical protein
MPSSISHQPLGAEASSVGGLGAEALAKAASALLHQSGGSRIRLPPDHQPLGAEALAKGTSPIRQHRLFMPFGLGKWRVWDPKIDEMPDNIHHAPILALKPVKIPEVNFDDEHRRTQRRHGPHVLIIVDLFPDNLLKAFSTTTGGLPGNRKGYPW